jgi:hypothetical protein
MKTWLHGNWADRLGVMGLALAFLSVSLVGQSAPVAAADTYSWSAELVAVDEAARRVTLKVPVLDVEPVELSKFAAGDSVTLLLSGLYDYAFGIRRVAAGRAFEEERFAMPVEFVASETDGRYVSFAVTLPAGGIEPIKGLNPGEWVTVTSPVAPEGRLTRLEAIRPYITTTTE